MKGAEDEMGKKTTAAINVGHLAFLYNKINAKAN